MNARRSSRWPQRVLAFTAILCGIMLALGSLYRMAFQIWLSATPDSTGRESDIALQSACIGICGLAVAGLGVRQLMRTP